MPYWKVEDLMDLIERYISVNPEICHGKPCFKGTRIMVYLILEMLEAGATITDIQEAYPDLTPEHVQAALHYAARVLEYRELDPAFLKVRDALFAR
jgi:uncharacterized protein (DUF433 family)